MASKAVPVLAKSGIAVGLNKGHVVTQRDKKLKPSHSKGKLGKQATSCHDAARLQAGWEKQSEHHMLQQHNHVYS